MLPGCWFELARSTDTNAAGDAVTVIPLLLGRARLHTGPPGERWFRDGW